MSRMGKAFKYPPCVMNPMTELPYTRHKWEIPQGAEVIVRYKGEEPVYYYRVRCARCGLNDPKAPTH